MKILIIIPAYNEQENIENVIIHLSQTVPEADYVVIDDCSTDHTQEICRRNGFRYVSLPVNLGIGGGVQTGYLYAKEHDYDIAVQMDGDGQHDPKYLKAVIEPLCNNEADMVIGSRFLEKEGFQSSAMRRLGIKIIHGIIRVLCRADIKDPTSGFRATNKELTAFFSENYAQDYPEPEAIIAAELSGFRVKEVPVVMNERLGGESSIGGLKSAYYMIKVTLALIICRMSYKRKKGRKNGQ